MKLLKKGWWIFLILIIIIAIGITTMIINSNHPAEKYYVYVRNEEIILNNNDFSKSTILSENYGETTNYNALFEISKDKSKVIFSDNILDDSFSIKYTVVNDLFDDTEAKSTMVASNVQEAKTTQNGIAYIKNDNLYYHDFISQENIAKNVNEFEISENGNIIYYINNDSILYRKDLTEDSLTKISDNVEGMTIFENSIIYTKENKSEIELYKDEELLTNNFYSLQGINEDGIYFIAADKEIQNNNDDYQVIVIGMDDTSYTEKLKEMLDENGEKYTYYSYYSKDAEKFIEKYNETIEWFPVTYILKDKQIVKRIDGYESEEKIYNEFKAAGYESEGKISYENLSSYIYDGKDITKISDGIILYMENFEKSENVIYAKWDDNSEDATIYVLDTNNGKSLRIGQASDYDNFIYNPLYNTLYYGQNDIYYQVNIENNHLKNEKEIGEDICEMMFNNSTTYFIENCTDINTLHILEADNDLLISDNVTSIYPIDNKLYYLTELRENRELYYYNDESYLISDEIDFSYELNNNLYYFKSSYDSSKNNNTYADLYVVKGSESKLIDSDVDTAFLIKEI